MNETARHTGYREAWAAHAGPPRFEQADIPVRLQTEADLLAEAAWALLAWEDPRAEIWRSPFWSGVPMLIGEPDPEPWASSAPLLGMLAEAGARVEGLRLLDGRFVLKAELGNALLQILVPSGRAFGPGDGIMARLELPLPLEAVVARIGDLWRVTGRPPPPRNGRRGAGVVARRGAGALTAGRRTNCLRSSQSNALASASFSKKASGSNASRACQSLSTTSRRASGRFSGRVAKTLRS